MTGFSDKISLFCSLALLCSVATSCTLSDAPFAEDLGTTTSEAVFGENLPEENLLHQMNICVEDDLLEELENATGEDGFVDLSGFEEFRGLGVIRMRRLFPHAGEFEERTREAGLHRWYVLDYEESRSMTKAAAGLALPGVSEIEYCPRMEIIGN
ncbi:MAG: subtilase family N-terminal domain-containing protein, partial [Candidatus Cryptobacteroides sp.]